MPDEVENETIKRAETTRERFHRTLASRAADIKSVRNDVFMLKVWQLALNFLLGGGTIALLVVSMINTELVGTICMICGIVLFVVAIIYNVALRARSPMSFLQYTAYDRGRRCCYQIISKTRAAFSDGEHSVEVDKTSYVGEAGLCYPQYPFDFFAEMDADVRIASAEKETFKGTIEVDGKTKKCSITFKNGVVSSGTIGGVRIKYFDVNETSVKFVVPKTLRDAAKCCGFELPKLPGVHITDADATRQ